MWRSEQDRQKSWSETLADRHSADIRQGITLTFGGFVDWLDYQGITCAAALWSQHAANKHEANKRVANKHAANKHAANKIHDTTS